MQDKTIDNALLQLRRAGGDIQVHAEALLTLRGVELLPLRMLGVRFRQRELKTLVLGALRERPMTGKELTNYIAARRPDMTTQRVYDRLYQALARYKYEGLVRREGRVWGLANPLKAESAGRC